MICLPPFDILQLETKVARASVVMLGPSKLAMLNPGLRGPMFPAENDVGKCVTCSHLSTTRRCTLEWAHKFPVDRVTQVALALGPLEIHLRHLRQLCCESSAVAYHNSQEAVAARKCTRPSSGTANRSGLIHPVCRRVCSPGHKCIKLWQATPSSSVCRWSTSDWKKVTETGIHTTCNAPSKLHNFFVTISQ